uniref:Enoyl-CoA hydratase domain-containing protein 3, mitochondrial n=1 Tax=Schistosoma haematobium TaxID=6185 RepID=A0A094ZQ23_SCHHA
MINTVIQIPIVKTSSKKSSLISNIVEDVSSLNNDIVADAKSIMEKLTEFPIPSIASVNGPAVAGGCQETKLFLGKAISADRAYELGLVHRVVEDDKLYEASIEFAKEITQHNKDVVQLGRETLHKQASMSLMDAYAIASDAMVSIYLFICLFLKTLYLATLCNGNVIEFNTNVQVLQFVKLDIVYLSDSKRFRISITFKMEKNSQGKNNPITKNETVADISNSSVDDNSLISRATKAVRDYLEYDFECLVSDVNILTRMNQASSERYMELTTNTNDMTRKLIDVNNRFASLSDALKKIDQFDKDIEQLEKKAFEIETLTKQLGRYDISAFNYEIGTKKPGILADLK